MRRRTLRHVFILLLLWAAGAAADTLTFEPVADTSIYRGDGFDNVSDGVGENLWVATTAGGVTRRALLRFDLSAVPPGSAIASATLTLYHSRGRDTHVVSLHRVLTGWGEGASNGGGAGTGAPATAGDATWINARHPAIAWNTPGGDFVAAASAQLEVSGSIVTSSFFTWGSTAATVADVKAWVDAPGSNFGWVVIGDEITLQNAKKFSSRQSTFAPVRPKLTVTFTPPPPAAESGDVPLPAWALALLGAGLLWAGRAFQSRRRG